MDYQEHENKIKKIVSDFSPELTQLNLDKYANTSVLGKARDLLKKYAFGSKTASYNYYVQNPNIEDHDTLRRAEAHFVCARLPKQAFSIDEGMFKTAKTNSQYGSSNTASVEMKEFLEWRQSEIDEALELIEAWKQGQTATSNFDQKLIGIRNKGYFK